MSDAWTHLAVFAAMVAVDFVWALYTRAIQDGRAAPAAVWSMGVVALGGFSISQYATNPIYIVSAALGAFAGTYGAVWLKRK